MAAAFDPYRKWLGIPDGVRPPSHYQLLAIAEQETDAEVIHAAVIRQSAYVRNFQTGPYSDQATRLLGELAAAKACLSDPQRRAAYDAELPRTQPTAAPPPATPAATNVPPALPLPASAPLPTAPANYAYPTAPPAAPWGAPPQAYGQAAWGAAPQAAWQQPYEHRLAPGRSIPVWVWAAGAMGSCLVVTLVVALVLVLQKTNRTPLAQDSTLPATAAEGQSGINAPTDASAPPAITEAAALPAGGASPASHIASGAAVNAQPASSPPAPAAPATAAAPAAESSLSPAGPAANITFDDSQVRLQRFSDLSWGLQSLAFSPDSNLVAGGKQDRAIMLFDLARGTRIAFVEDLEILGQVTSCAFSPNGAQLIAGGHSGAILVWDVDPATGLRQSGQFSGHVKEITCQSVSPDGGFVLSGSKDKSLRYWELNTRREAHSWQDFQHELLACQVLPGGGAAMATDGTNVLAVDLSTGATLRTIPLGGRGRVVALSPDGRYFARDHIYSIELWDLERGALVAAFEGNETPWALAFSPDGNYFVSGGRGKLNVWSMATHQRILAIDTGVVFYHYPLAISPDSRRIAVYPQAAGQELVIAHLPPPR